MKSVLLIGGLILLAILVKYFYFKPMLVYGQDAPRFEVIDLAGQPIKLEDFKDHYLLIDFGEVGVDLVEPRIQYLL